MDALRRTLGIDSSEVVQVQQSSTEQSMVIVDRVGAPPVLEETSRPQEDNQEDGSQLQMRDRLVNMWNNMKFSKTLWSLESSASGAKSRMTRLSPAWLLGQSYHKPSTSSRSSISDLDAADIPTASSPTAALTPLMDDFHTRVWMTYRKGFECFPKTQIDSDCGWGCMIRAGQMIVANTLIELHLGRQWRWSQNLHENGVITGDDIHNEALHRDIVRLFADQQTAPLSIHKIVEMGQQTINAKPGDWFGPGSTAHLLRQALDLALVTADHPQVTELLNLRIYVSTDGTVFKQDVVDLGKSNAGKSKSQQQQPGVSISTKPQGGGSQSLSPPQPIMARSVEEGYSVVNTPHEESFEVTHDEVAEEAVMLDDSVREYSLSQQVSVDGETWVTEEYSAPVVHQAQPQPSAPKNTRPEGPANKSVTGQAEPPVQLYPKLSRTSEPEPLVQAEPPLTPPEIPPDDWTPVLLLVPVRLGSGEKVNRIYAPHVKALLTSDHCVGIIGGRPKHALYFMGFQDDNLLHLDPHLVQDSVDVNCPDFDLSTYHCRSVRKMSLSKMDPSCCIGFLCRTRDAFDAWCEASSAATDYPIYCVMEGRVSDHLADGERVLNQLTMPELDQDDQDGAACPGTTSGVPRQNSSGSFTAVSDTDDFVIL